MSNFDAIRERLAEANPEALLADGFEDALIGTVEHFGSSQRSFVALYDASKCIEILVERDGMTFEEAVEFFEFNTLGAYAGPHTPAFATLGAE